jgi:hypothetical protein
MTGHPRTRPPLLRVTNGQILLTSHVGRGCKVARNVALFQKQTQPSRKPSNAVCEPVTAACSLMPGLQLLQQQHLPDFDCSCDLSLLPNLPVPHFNDLHLLGQHQLPFHKVCVTVTCNLSLLRFLPALIITVPLPPPQLLGQHQLPRW